MRLAIILILFHFLNVHSVEGILTVKTKGITDRPNFPEVVTTSAPDFNSKNVTESNATEPFTAMVITELEPSATTNLTEPLTTTNSTEPSPTTRPFANITETSTASTANVSSAASGNNSTSNFTNVSPSANLTNGSSIVPVTVLLTNISTTTGNGSTRTTPTTPSAKTKVITESPDTMNTTVLPFTTESNITVLPTSTINVTAEVNSSTPIIAVTVSMHSHDEDIDETEPSKQIEPAPDKDKESGGIGTLLTILLIICLLLCVAGFCWWYLSSRTRQQSSPGPQPSHVVANKRVEQPLVLAANVPPPSLERSGDDEIQAIEFKHAGPIQLQTKQHSISLVHELDMDKTPSQSAADQLVIDSALNEVYEIGSDVELRMDGDQPLKPAEKHPPVHGRDMAIRE